MARRKLVVREPALVGPQLGVKRPAPDLKLAVALDLGTLCGIAYTWFLPGRPWDPASRPIYGGLLDLSVGDYDSGAVRFVRLRQFLAAIDPDVVFHEDVSFTGSKENFGPHPTVHQVVARVARPIELFGSFKATVATWAEERNVPCLGVSIQAIKRRATGRGNANKEQVIQAANEVFGMDLEVEEYEKLGSDNIADAVWCLVAGLEGLAEGIAPAA